MRTFHLLAGSVVLSLCSAGCDFSWQVIEGSGHEKSETREVAGFEAVLVKDSITAEITLAPDQPQSVEVRGDDNVVPLVRTYVAAGKLVLELPPSLGYSPKLPLVVTISTTALHWLEASDSAVASANRVEGEDVSVASSDSSEVTVGEIGAAGSVSISAVDSSTVSTEAVTAGGALSISATDSSTVEAHDIAASGALTVTVEDSSGVTVDGDAPRLDASMSDSSQLEAAELTVETVVIEATDSAVADVCATASLDATLSDSSAVSYGCEPEDVTRELDGSSTLTKK